MHIKTIQRDSKSTAAFHAEFMEQHQDLILVTSLQNFCWLFYGKGVLCSNFIINNEMTKATTKNVFVFLL